MRDINVSILPGQGNVQDELVIQVGDRTFCLTREEAERVWFRLGCNLQDIEMEHAPPTTKYREVGSIIKLVGEEWVECSVYQCPICAYDFEEDHHPLECPNCRGDAHYWAEMNPDEDDLPF